MLLWCFRVNSIVSQSEFNCPSEISAPRATPPPPPPPPGLLPLPSPAVAAEEEREVVDVGCWKLVLVVEGEELFAIRNTQACANYRSELQTPSRVTDFNH
jgi:hypothetical protein